MTEEQLKAYIKQNLRLVIEQTYNGPQISLKFDDDIIPFSTEWLPSLKEYLDD